MSDWVLGIAWFGIVIAIVLYERREWRDFKRQAEKDGLLKPHTTIEE